MTRAGTKPGTTAGEGGGSKPIGAYAKPIGAGAAVAGLSFAGIFGAIMLFPKAVGDVMFPFLPEEMRPFASCCSSCSSVMSVIALVLFMLVKR